MNENDKVCPDCAETIRQAARVCKHCGYRFLRPATDDTAPVKEAPSTQVPANEGRGPITVNFIRQHMWVRLGDRLTIYADDIEIGEIGGGEEQEIVLPASSRFIDIKIRQSLTPLTVQVLPVDQVKDGDTILIKSTATMRDFFSHELLEFEIVQPDTVVEVGTSKWPALLAAVAAAFFLTFAAVALVKEGPRLIKGYDSNKQMEAAEAGGFSDKETFLAAQAAGISTAGDWGKFSTDMAKAGFDDAAEFMAFREQEKAKKEEAGRLAREAERRNELLREEGQYWMSCSAAMMGGAAVLIGRGIDANSNVQSAKMFHKLAVGYFALTGVNENEAKKILDDNLMNDPNMVQIQKFSEMKDLNSASEILINVSKRCFEKAKGLIQSKNIDFQNVVGASNFGDLNF